MNAQVMGARIAESRSQKGLSQTQLAEQMDISPQSVQQWEAGKTMPRGKRLERLSEVLDKPISYFLAESVDDVSPIRLRQSVPLIDWVSAGMWANSQTTREGEYQQVLSVFDTGKNGYALRVEGESMLPRYQPNDIIYVNPDAEPAVGKRVIAVCSEGTTFKEVIAGEGGKLMLKALNEHWHPRYMLLDDSCYIIGVVVGSVRPE